MAYTPVNWQTGDTITAERLNRMDRGWSVETTELFSETVTTADNGGDFYSAPLAYSQLIDADTITVTFDGTEYECPSIGEGEYGASYNGRVFDFSEFPFKLYTYDGGAELVTQTAGEHTVAAAAQTLQTSADFAAAVNMVASSIDASTLPLRCVEGVTTYNEATSAMESGRLVYFTANDETYEVVPKCFMVNTVGTTCTIVPTSTKIAAKFGADDGLFYIKHLSS